MKVQKLKSQKGITLVALVITINNGITGIASSKARKCNIR